MSTTQSSIFLSGLKDDILLLDGEEALKIEKLLKEKYVSLHHNRAISYRDSKALWRTFVGDPRKEVTRKEKDELIDFLFQYYKTQETPSMTIEDVFEQAEEYRLHTLNRSQNTIERDKQVIRRFFTDEFMNRPIITVTADEICKYINDRSDELGLKDRALKDSVQVLSRIFEYAVHEKRIIPSNPVLDVDLSNYYQNCDNTVKTSDEKIFTPDEIRDIQKRIHSEMADKDYDPVGYAMLFSIETGVRVAEIPPLRWTDITEKGIHIHCQQRMTRIKGKGRTYEELPFTKNERRHPKGGRYFPLTDAIQNILDEVREMQKKYGVTSEFIFCNADGTWLNKETYSQRLRRMCRRIGLEITNNHAFRMSLNSNVFIPAGITVAQRAYLLGHSVETNERFYSHMRTESLEDLKNVLNQSTHTYSHTKITDFPKIKIPQTQ